MTNKRQEREQAIHFMLTDNDRDGRISPADPLHWLDRSYDHHSTGDLEGIYDKINNVQGFLAGLSKHLIKKGLITAEEIQNILDEECFL